MTDKTLDLDSIEARANAATPGPWCTDSWEIYQGTEYEPGISEWIGETCRGMTTPAQDRADAAFIAAARTDVPALVAEIRRLRAELATERSQHEFTMRQRNNRSRRLLHLRDLAKAGDPNVLAAAALDTLAASVDDHLGCDERAAAVPAAGVTGE